MLLAHKPNKVAICGGSGTGKTTFWQKYLINSDYPIKFIFDHEGEMVIRLKQANCGFWECYTPEQLGQAAEKGGMIVFDPSQMFEGNLPGAFDFFCDWAFQVSKLPNFLTAKKLFACDELQNLIGTDIVNPYVSCILETGRRYGIDWASVQQAMNLVHNRVRNQMTEVVAFRTLEEQATRFLISVGFPENIRELKDGQYIIRNMRNGMLTSGKVF